MIEQRSICYSVPFVLFKKKKQNHNEDKSDHRILSASKLSADKYQHMIALAQTQGHISL